MQIVKEHVLGCSYIAEYFLLSQSQQWLISGLGEDQEKGAFIFLFLPHFKQISGKNEFRAVKKK